MAITIIGGGFGLGKVSQGEIEKESPEDAERRRQLREALVEEVCADARKLIEDHGEIVDHPDEVSMSFLRIKDFVRASATERHQDVPFRLLLSLLPDARLAGSMMDSSLRIAELQDQVDELKRLRNVVAKARTA
jgi:hypothetical protein